MVRRPCQARSLKHEGRLSHSSFSIVAHPPRSRARMRTGRDLIACTHVVTVPVLAVIVSSLSLLSFAGGLGHALGPAMVPGAASRCHRLSIAIRSEFERLGSTLPRPASRGCCALAPSVATNGPDHDPSGNKSRAIGPFARLLTPLTVRDLIRTPSRSAETGSAIRLAP